MDYFIYLTTNRANGKRYIGQHKGSVKDSYLGSGILLKKAIEKDGKENFTREILELCKEEELDEKEKEWIKRYNALEDENFYNLSEGGQKGDGWKAAQKYFKNHPEEAKALYEENGKRLKEWGKNHPEETKKNIEKMIEGSKAWRNENPDLVLENAKRLNEAKEKWQKEHPIERQKQVDKWRMAGSLANSKKVKCIQTGIIFDSISEAARYYGVSQPNISKVLRGERQTCGKLPDGTKLSWEYV